MKKMLLYIIQWARVRKNMSYSFKTRPLKMTFCLRFFLFSGKSRFSGALLLHGFRFVNVYFEYFILEISLIDSTIV